MERAKGWLGMVTGANTERTAVASIAEFPAGRGNARTGGREPPRAFASDRSR